MKEIEVFAPATVANVAAGFDVLGFALTCPGDRMTVRRNDTGKFHLFNETTSKLPLEPNENVATVALRSMLHELGQDEGYDIIFNTKINPGSGIGSSAASSVAPVFAVNELLGQPLTKRELIPYAMVGEGLASGGAMHADNIAPCMLGGFTLAQSYDPNLEIHQVPSPKDLCCALVFPDIEIKTSEARKLLPKELPIKTAITQWANLAGLILGLTTSDYSIISKSLRDVVAEPARSVLIPRFYDVKNAAINNGALGCSISGSGPSIFALCRDQETATKVAVAMHAVFEEMGMACEKYVSAVNHEGVRVL